MESQLDREVLETGNTSGTLVPPLEGKVTGKSNYQRFSPPRLHSLTLCQPGCADAHNRETKNKASCRTLLSKALPATFSSPGTLV